MRRLCVAEGRLKAEGGVSLPSGIWMGSEEPLDLKSVSAGWMMLLILFKGAATGAGGDP